MARVLGKPGRYVEDQSVKQAQLFILWGLIAVAFFAGSVGFTVGLAINSHKFPWLALPILLVVCVLVFSAKRYLFIKLDTLVRKGISFRKGAVGEALIAGILEGLSNDYVVINDLSTQFGNLDHVVVGPTGAFVIDTKNWKGTVTPDGNGELLQNGKPTSKPEVKNLVRTVMNCREQVMTLCKLNGLDCDLYVQAVLAFPSAYVDAPFKSVKNADCLTDERLIDYITDEYNAGKLNKAQIETVSQAFLALARMDRGFSDTASTQSSAS